MWRQGGIVESGSHRSLVRRGGIYAGLVAKQSGGGLGSNRAPATVRLPSASHSPALSFALCTQYVRIQADHSLCARSDRG